MKPLHVVASLVAAATVMAGAAVADGAPGEKGLFDGSLSAEQPAERIPPRRATIISDSATAGIRWNGALEGLRGFDADHRLESCRRLVDASCFGREGRRPRTVLAEIAQLPAVRPTDVLVVATGYNDFDYKFPKHLRQVLDAAVAKGYLTIAWTTYRENVGYVLPEDTDRAVSNYQAMNAELRAVVASGDYPQLQLWDLNDYTHAASQSWFTTDGIHQLRRGSWGVADWISRKMAHISELACPLPWGEGYPIEEPCPDPNEVRPARGYPQLDALYEF